MTGIRGIVLIWQLSFEILFVCDTLSRFDGFKLSTLFSFIEFIALLFRASLGDDYGDVLEVDLSSYLKLLCFLFSLWRVLNYYSE